MPESTDFLDTFQMACQLLPSGSTNSNIPLILRTVAIACNTDNRKPQDILADTDFRGTADIAKVADSARIMAQSMLPGTRSTAIRYAYEALMSEKRLDGCYYTPGNIADMIVRFTLQPLVDERSIEEILKLRIVDPAMGAGEFLVCAVEFLTSEILKRKPELDEIQVRKAASACMYGVDIDPMAVEAARLCLWIETGCEWADIEKRVFCTDSLLDDWYDTGFDAVIGNPPYLFGERIPSSIRSNADKFDFAHGQFDVYWLFYELAFGSLLSENGCHGFIVPDAILARDETLCIREKITKNWKLLNLVHAGEVFPDPNVSSAIVVWRKQPTEDNRVETLLLNTDEPEEPTRVSQTILAGLPGCKWLIGLDHDEAAFIHGIYQRTQPLGSVAKTSRGEELGKSSLLQSDQTVEEETVPIMAGDDVITLGQSIPSRHIRKSDVHKREALYSSPKIVLVKTGASIKAAMDMENTVTLQSVYNIHVHGCDPWYLCGLICSDLINSIVRRTFTENKRLFPQLNQSTVESIPLVIPDETDDKGKQLCARIANLAEQAYSASIEERQLLRSRIDDLVLELYGVECTE